MSMSPISHLKMWPSETASWVKVAEKCITTKECCLAGSSDFCLFTGSDLS